MENKKEVLLGNEEHLVSGFFTLPEPLKSLWENPEEDIWDECL